MSSRVTTFFISFLKKFQILRHFVHEICCSYLVEHNIQKNSLSIEVVH